MAEPSASKEFITTGALPGEKSEMEKNRDRIELLQFMNQHDFSGPDVPAVEDAFRELHHHLHSHLFLQELQASDATALPQIEVFPMGQFILNLPSKGVPNKFVVFGTISPAIYHDMVWEHIQHAPEYTQLQAGIYEVEKLPVLKFLIYFKGYEFELKYYQSVDFVRQYHSVHSTSPMLAASVESLDQLCTKEVKDLVLQIQRGSKLRKGFQQPNVSFTYYLCRAWATLHGAPGQEVDDDIIKVLAHNLDQPIPKNYSQCHPILRKLIVRASVEQLWLVPDKRWVEILKEVEGTPISTRIASTHFLAINVLHSGCSNLQASKWLRYVQSRWPMLEYMMDDIDAIPMLWPNRLVAVGADPQASDYEGCYLFGLDLRPWCDATAITPSVERWLEVIKRHETTLPGNCFIFYEFKSRLEFQEEEKQNGGFKPCRKSLTRSFMPPANPIESTVLGVDSKPPKAKPAPPQNVVPGEPTPKLRPAFDILSRLRHDLSYNIDEYFIGYEDRFSDEIMEVAAQSWIKETTHEAFIPETRIRYFKRRWDNGKEEVVWDRGKKLDLICGSGVKRS